MRRVGSILARRHGVWDPTGGAYNRHSICNYASKRFKREIGRSGRTDMAAVREGVRHLQNSLQHQDKQHKHRLQHF
ncbi:hypothetical protein WJX75_008843 [Coccomyxa subellipsoidea]|uniref:Uncharacterized protein n=1 Tax=Coccomyxa subellipsoidea TaxID=248742 RepID=A0ABR2YU65_9CHLO